MNSLQIEKNTPKNFPFSFIIYLYLLIINTLKNRTLISPNKIFSSLY